MYAARLKNDKDLLMEKCTLKFFPNPLLVLYQFAISISEKKLAL